MHKALWFLPPLFGIGFYAAGSVALSRHVSVAAAPLPEKVADRSATAAVDPSPPEEQGDERKENAAEDFAPPGQDGIAALGADDLKELIVKLREKIRTAKRGEVDEDWEAFLKLAAGRLFELQKGDAMPWLLEHLPGMRAEFMAQWAKVDPAAVFEAVVHSGTASPCSDETLGSLLHGFAVQGGGPLREASLRVPWDLFIGSPEATGRPSISMREAGDLTPWLESGVLPELQRRGVMISEVLQEWANQRPREVLAQWKAGNELIVAEPTTVFDLLSPNSLRSFDQEVEIAKALSELPVKEQKRLVGMMSEDGELPDNKTFAKWKESFDPNRAAAFIERGKH